MHPAAVNHLLAPANLSLDPSVGLAASAHVASVATVGPWACAAVLGLWVAGVAVAMGRARRTGDYRA